MSNSHPIIEFIELQEAAGQICPKCGKTWPLKMFSKRRRQCKQCIAEYHIARYARGQRTRPYRPSHLSNIEKYCPKCKQTKPAECFGIRGNAKYLKSYCYDCEAVEWRNRRKAYKERYPDQMRAQQARADLRVNHGITLAQYDEILSAQGGGCAICGAAKPSKHRERLYIDHNHETGVIRGLLCDNCNRGIGHLGEDIERLLKAVEYLRAPGTGLISVSKRRLGVYKRKGK